jgi:hypothetical protein
VPAYGQIRTALSRGFYVDNLRTITKLSLEVLQQENLKHPAIFLVLASLSRWVADAWDDIPLRAPVADRVESQLKAHLEALLNVADGDSAEVCTALDAAAAAFREVVARGLDSDLA